MKNLDIAAEDAPAVLFSEIPDLRGVSLDFDGADTEIAIAMSRLVGAGAQPLDVAAFQSSL